jgi:hypothetical protein
MIGFVDESMRAGGLYVVAAVIVPGDLDNARQAVKSVLLPHQPRFHWRAESDEQRHRMLEQVRALSTAAPAYVCRSVSRRERARRLCLDRLLWDLIGRDVDLLVFESRQARNDHKDQKAIADAQRAKRAPLELRHVFERPHREPLLWLPDAVAGAVATAVGDGVDDYLVRLGEHVRVIDITP